MNGTNGLAMLMGSSNSNLGAETDEERKKRLLAQQAARLLPQSGLGTLMQGYGGAGR